MKKPLELLSDRQKEVITSVIHSKLYEVLSSPFPGEKPERITRDLAQKLCAFSEAITEDIDNAIKLNIAIRHVRNQTK
jgi:hypothetical protein